ncbi:kinase-like domain-containing protein [Rhizophagus clarus]|uniref:Kinase-like domain-containing protein n=1 Tax=Rhizophagus clarus TaxID=94130 RepID=A0A8H3LQ41_9GLOM|nr:kinase-like domain-containing protein [Rhizophagus clarus]
MSTVRKDSINAIVNRAYTLLDSNVHDNIHKKFEFQRDIVLADETLTVNQKTKAIKKLTKYYDRNKVLFNDGTTRTCEMCNQECLATLFCEHCVRNYLKAKFSSWTSENQEIDKLIQECQMETLGPDYTVEWIPFDNLQNVKYLTEGGISKIYTAEWINGHYDEWDFEKKKLKRSGTFEVILKGLENVENADHSWFEEAKSHLTINNKRPEIVRCYGLTKDASKGNYMLVMMKMNMDLREYLQRNYDQLSWKKKIRITLEIIDALYYIHQEKAIHRDLHSGNVLYSQFEDYCIAMLMWEISSCRPPFTDRKHDYDLITNILHGLRPKIVPGTPLEYSSLIKQCWDNDPSKRPDICTIRHKIIEISKSYQNMPDEPLQSSYSDLKMDKYSSLEINFSGSKLFTYKFNDLPKNTTAFGTKVYELTIPDNVEFEDDDFNEEEHSLNSNFKTTKGLFKD